ncbi:hypothetical protein BDV95DRAFT_599186 [Massariosphaeria phaeospora]|uniref:Uncharacterized protein n=1 Tax=Massariosphaeria phaeospora TaxID=100035 RepID=A0A7C8M2F2_9PLEO|nr:hypothetical protein BDV95DRAFT_599186 [Massariosphaeria phaeospora]
MPAAQPWTPPEMDEHSDYFSDSALYPLSPIKDQESSWPLSTASPPSYESSSPSSSHNAHAALSQLRPKPTSHLAEPHTPTKQTSHDDAHNLPPQYPYTPDSARSTRTYNFPDLSPLPPMPWDNDEQPSTSPIQNALASCISHLENLIRTQQPNETQMEYIVSQLESLTSYLSAPESQSRPSDDHLFPELDPPDSPDALGISGASPASKADRASQTEDAFDEQSVYVSEVGKYIEGVQKHSRDLGDRLEEVKQLNSIQLEIIDDLRLELRRRNRGSQKRATIAPRVQRIGFWGAVGEALDAVGEMLLEW